MNVWQWADVRRTARAPTGLTKSITISLAERRLNAVRHADSTELLEIILQDTMPMHPRMIHRKGKDGGEIQEPQAYDTHGRACSNQAFSSDSNTSVTCTWAVDRAGLNKRMLDVLQSLPNVTLHFSHKPIGANVAQSVPQAKSVRKRSRPTSAWWSEPMVHIRPLASTWWST